VMLVTDVEGRRKKEEGRRERFEALVSTIA
jgi:hypothetical protein